MKNIVEISASRGELDWTVAVGLSLDWYLSVSVIFRTCAIGMYVLIFL